MYRLGERGPCIHRILPTEKVGWLCANVIQTLTVLRAENDMEGRFGQFPDMPQTDLAMHVSKTYKTYFIPWKKSWSWRYSFELKILFLLMVTFSAPLSLPIKKSLNYLFASFSLLWETLARGAEIHYHHIIVFFISITFSEELWANL